MTSVALSATSSMTSEIDSQIDHIKEYFSLEQQNQLLRAENARLMDVVNMLSVKDSVKVDTALRMGAKILVLKVVKNSYTKQQNHIILKGGVKQGVKPDMALFNNDGIVGYVIKCSDNFSVAVSVLNSVHFRTSGRLQHTDFTGSISWTGENYRFVKISELPKYADLHKGDTILTTSYSNIFPSDMPIGVIDQFELTNGTFYEASIQLFADMSSLNYVYAVIIDRHDERAELEKTVIE